MKKVYILLLAICFIFSACSTLRTDFDYDRTIDFSKYKTFAFHQEGIAQTQLNEIDKKRFTKAITINLAQKGLQLDTKQPDLLVNIVIKNKKRTSLYESYPSYYDWWYSSNAMTVYDYTESSIYIDIIDRAENQLIWQGKGTDEFNAYENDKEARIQETTSKILARYPNRKTQ